MCKYPWLVELEPLVALAGRLGLERVQVANAMAAQAPVQARARDAGADEFLCPCCQQVIKRQQQGAEQMHQHYLLCWGELGLQAMRCVRTMLEAGALLPLARSLFADVEEPCKRCS